MNNTPKHKGCNNNLPDTQHSSKSNELQITKETDTATKSFDQTLLRANLGDRMLRSLWVTFTRKAMGLHKITKQSWVGISKLPSKAIRLVNAE
jgi:hypothetical protein